MTAQQAPWADGVLVTTPTMTAIMKALGLDCLSPSWDGWVDDSVGGGWSMSTATAIYAGSTGTGHQETRYPVGAHLSCTDAGVTKYGWVLAASYDGGQNATAVNAIWGLANGTATTLSGGLLTDPRISYMATPYGFPTYFNFAASPVGISPITTNVAQFAINGRQCTVWFNFAGTGSTTGRTCTAPVATASSTPLAIISTNNAGTNADGIAIVLASTITFYYNASYAGWTASGATQVQGTLTYPI